MQPTVLDPAEVLARPPLATGFRRRAAVVLGVAAPVLLLAGTLLAPRLSGTNEAVYAALPPVLTRLFASHLCNLLAGLLFTATVLVTWRIPDRAGSVLRTVGGAVAIVGFTSDAVGEAVWGYASWAGVQAAVPAAPMGRLFDVLDDAPLALPVSWLAIPVLVVGLLLLWAGVLRAHRSVPVWAPIAAIAGTVLGGLLTAWPLSLLGAIGTVGTVAVTLYAARAGEA